MFNKHLKTLLNILKQKKTIFSLSTILLIVLIIDFSISPSSQQSLSTNQALITPAAGNSNNIPPSASGNTSAPANSNLLKWNTFKADAFSVQHSPDWIVQKGGIAGGGEVVIIKPNMSSTEIIYPSLIIQTQPAAQNVIEQKIEIMKALGLVDSEINIFDQKAHKLSGTIPFKTAAGGKINEPIQETNILLMHGDLIYTLQYTYEGEKINPDLEEYFNGIIKGIKLKK